MIVGAKVAKKIRIMRNLFLKISKLHYYRIKNQHFIHKIQGKYYIFATLFNYIFY